MRPPSGWFCVKDPLKNYRYDIKMQEEDQSAEIGDDIAKRLETENIVGKKA